MKGKEIVEIINIFGSDKKVRSRIGYRNGWSILLTMKWLKTLVFGVTKSIRNSRSLSPLKSENDKRAPFGILIAIHDYIRSWLQKSPEPQKATKLDPFATIKLARDVNLEEIIASDCSSSINYTYEDVEFYKIYFKLPEDYRMRFSDKHVYRTAKADILLDRPDIIPEKIFLKTQFFRHCMEREFVYANIKLVEYMAAIDERLNTSLVKSIEMSNGTIEYLDRYQVRFENERYLYSSLSDKQEPLLVQDTIIMRNLYEYLSDITDNPFIQPFSDLEIHGFLSYPNWSDIVILLILITRCILVYAAVGNGQEGIDRYLFWNKQLSIIFGYHLAPIEIRAVENRWLEYKYLEVNKKRHFYFVERDFQTYVRVFARLKKKYYWKSNDEVITLSDRFWSDWLALRDQNPYFMLRSVDKLFLELVKTRLSVEEQIPPKDEEEDSGEEQTSSATDGNESNRSERGRGMITSFISKIFTRIKNFFTSKRTSYDDPKQASSVDSANGHSDDRRENYEKNSNVLNDKAESEGEEYERSGMKNPVVEQQTRVTEVDVKVGWLGRFKNALKKFFGRSDNDVKR